MAPEQIESLAQAIANRQLLQLGMPFLLGLLITGLLAAGAAFLGSYLQERGKNYATKQDFEELLKQLRQTTEATAEIKTQIEHADWLKREAMSLRRQKAETLILSTYEARDYLQSASKEVLFGRRQEVDYSPGSKASMLISLYFSELTREGTVFGALCARMAGILRDLLLAGVQLAGDPARLEAERDLTENRIYQLNAQMLRLITYIECSIANEMARIAGSALPYNLPESPADEIAELVAEMR